MPSSIPGKPENVMPELMIFEVAASAFIIDNCELLRKGGNT